MTILVLIIAIILLLLLITVVKLNAYISLIMAALFVGVADGMDLQKLILSITNGIGNTLGSLILILGFGVVLGALLTETGATQKISAELIRVFGIQRAKYALLITGFVVGIALFYNAGFIVLIPIAYSIAQKTGQSFAYLAIAMASALSVTHGFLPPHPGPTAIAIIFKADIGRTLLYGAIISIPAIVAAGVIFPEVLKKIKSSPPPGLFISKHYADNELPGFGISLFTALIPVLLMATATACDFLEPTGGNVARFIRFVGDPGIAMLIAVLVAVTVLGAARGMSIKSLMDKTSTSVGGVAVIILIIGAGGAFKQVLIDSGTGGAISVYFSHSTLSPLFLGWLIATLIRISIGSATVAGITAAGIVQPLITTLHVSPELMVISIGAGSLMCSHVNDTGFWIFKEYLGLSIADTFRSWTIMETIVGIVGLLGVLALNMMV